MPLIIDKRGEELLGKKREEKGRKKSKSSLIWWSVTPELKNRRVIRIAVINRRLSSHVMCHRLRRHPLRGHRL